MKRLLIYVMTILVCFTVCSVAWSDSLSLSAKGNEKAPLPEKITYKKPAGDVPVKIQNLLGKWEGDWEGGINSYFIFENVTPDSAEMVYGYGKSPQSGIYQGGHERITARLETNSDDSTVKFSCQRKEFPALIEGTVSYDGKTINAMYAGRSKIEMNKTESPDFELPEMVTKKPKVTKGLKESVLLSLDNSVIEEKAPFPGYLYRPKDNAAHPGILFLHGSDGGNGDFNPFGQTPRIGKNASIPSLAREYARLGYVTYALCWFDCKHHEDYDDYPPDELKEIDIYNTTYEAFLWLKKSDYVQNKKVAIWGVSMGAEQALLLASLVGKHKESMKFIEPDAILAASPPDIATETFTQEEIDTLLRGEKYLSNGDSAWTFNDKKIKTGIPIDIQNYNSPVLITYFENDPMRWGVPINPENLVKKYLDNNIPHIFIHFCDENDMSKTLKEVRDNIDKNIIINFTKEKGHVSPSEQKSASLMFEAINLFLKTHLGD
jgi:dienelactone hydrolase